MGTWQLEVGKMAIYLMFPVGLFHYFNQPQYFEEWVTKTKRELYPPENADMRAEIQRVKIAIEEKHEAKILKELEKQRS
ncbi:protein PET100 homolog, mitochondrial-like [Agrilus planipennis]|uniref:Protein PET100 homolog, mitochondrial n=1 Tax=Agrilus planipennis TaxID=224129 RepID=A0A1W4XJ59_AGRPL|nr:protein PET100 homolog, mitochondrial [Agrilus planipennis]XP_025830375.1 protein PET100 homolog, mitochondrial-like [Agrilus planipennis]